MKIGLSFYEFGETESRPDFWKEDIMAAEVEI